MGKRAASYGVDVSDGTTAVTGKTEPNAGIVITAYDSIGKPIYANNVFTDYNSDYSFTFSGAAETVYINGEKVVK